jgi:MFS family permease
MSLTQFAILLTDTSSDQHLVCHPSIILTTTSNFSRGFTLSYGAFQAYYKSDLLSSSTPSAISWIGTVQAWLLIFFGVLSGPLFDLGYFRVMLVVGNFLVVFGIMMLSLSTEYWQVFLSQGICMGLGAGLLYIPSLALVGIWFDKKRAIALGIVMSGIAVGKVDDPRCSRSVADVK